VRGREEQANGPFGDERKSTGQLRLEVKTTKQNRGIISGRGGERNEKNRKDLKKLGKDRRRGEGGQNFPMWARPECPLLSLGKRK